jgi:hypothetical protein
MTSLEKLCRANRWRVRKGQFASDETSGFNGHFIVPLEGEMWHVILSDQLGWKHLSVTNAQKKIMPNWTVMCHLKDAFFGDDECCVQYHPAKEDYIDDCKWCLHLWTPLNEALPKPSIALI